MIEVEYAAKLEPIFTKPKRIKIIVGGRGSTKSTGVADWAAACMSQGELWCCAREQLNSIEESVHRTILDEIDRLSLPGFSDTKTSINHASGGRCFYRGLSRNVTSLKSTLSGVDKLWIEEGEDLTENTLRVLTASVRLNAKDTQRAIAGEEIKMPEIIITMNRGSREDAISKKWLDRAEAELQRCGYYEDDVLMVVEINYTDMPEEWFLMSGLEEERKDDYDKLSRAEYDHKWGGQYLEAMDLAIIIPEWFDAAIDAHKKLGFKPRGVKTVSHDPSDTGDPKGLCYRHGSVILEAMESTLPDVNEGLDWALDFTLEKRPDRFIWDTGGLGLSLKRQVSDSLSGTKIDYLPFNGASGPQRPEEYYQDSDKDDYSKKRKNKDYFKNLRAHCYGLLRDRFYNTYLAVEKGQYRDPDDLISLSSEIKHLAKLRAELCRIPKKNNGSGLFQIMDKSEMKIKYKIESPNIGDSVMMSELLHETKQKSLPPLKANTKYVV